MCAIQTVYDLDEIVVTATRYPAALQDIAVATVVIEREDIEHLHPQAVGDVLQMYSGIEIKDLGVPGAVSSIFIRGVPSSGTLVLLDGQSLNTVTTGMADLGMVSVNDIERIEIVKGPTSSIYGANALGGVVNIITTRDHQHPNVRFGTTLSTTDMSVPWQSREFFTGCGFPIGQVGAAISGGYTGSDGIRSNSDLTRYHAHGSAFYQGERIDLSFSGTYDDKEHGVPGPLPLIDALHVVPELGDSTATSLFDREHDVVMLGNGSVIWHPSPSVAWSNTFMVSRKTMAYVTTYQGGINGTAVTDHYEYVTYSMGFNSLLVHHFQHGTIAGGIDICYDTLDAEKRSLDTGDQDWCAGTYSLGGWGEAKIDLCGYAKINTSLRIDEHSTYGLFISPGCGIISMIRPNVMIKGSVGKTYRSPTFNDLYWPDVGNSDLVPEHGWTYEVRLESAPAPGLSAAVSCYLRDIYDRIAWLPRDDGLWQPQNVNRLIIRGIDFDLTYQPYRSMEMGMGGTYLNAVQRNSEIAYDYYDPFADTGSTVVVEAERKAAFIPDLTISGYMKISLPRGLILSLNGIFGTQRVNNYVNYDAYPWVGMDTKTLASYYDVQIAVSKRFLDRVTLHLGIKNLFDEQYTLQFGNTVHDLDYPMPGRTFFGKITVP
jgi:outer membrane cobalamin receptor